jgi:uncharacterized protein
LSRGWLIVFAKAPRPGLVKTRMSPPLSLDECAELYDEMLGDVLVASARFAAQLGLEPVIAFHPVDAAAEIISRAPPHFRIQTQRGEGLGQRMAHAASEAAAAGAERVLMRGSDSPGLPLACFEEALARLDAGDDVVLTPDQGGGYALIGLRRPEPRLFEMPMSTSTVLDQTLARARDLGLIASTTQSSFDIDVVGDLRLLNGIPPEKRADLCARTVQYLSTSTLRHVL